MSKYIKKLAISTVESFLDKKLMKNKISIGFDVSVHSTGIGIIKTSKNYLTVEKLKTIITPKNTNTLSALDSFISQLDSFKDVISQTYKINISIIEDCFMGRNVLTLKSLARHSALVYDRFRRLSDKCELVLPTRARSIVGFKKSKKAKGHQLKKEIVEYINNTLNLQLKVKDNDQADSLVLALAGLIGE